MDRLVLTIICTLLSMCLFVRDAKSQTVVGVKGEIASPAVAGAGRAGFSVMAGKQMKMALAQADFGYNPSSAHCDLSLLLRTYGNKDHSINMYLGAGLTGVVDIDGSSGKTFVAGAFPVIQAEAFISRRISLYADVRMPLLFLEHDIRVGARYSLGIRYLLYKEVRDE